MIQKEEEEEKNTKMFTIYNLFITYKVKLIRKVKINKKKKQTNCNK